MDIPFFAIPLFGYNRIFNFYKKLMKKTFGSSEKLIVTSTYQFSDYSKYAITIINGKKRLKRREEVFPKDCRKAFFTW